MEYKKSGVCFSIPHSLIDCWWAFIEEKIKNYDNVVFGTLAKPSPEKIINDGIKVRRDYLPAKKRYEDSGAKNPFHLKLRDGGIVSINKMIEPIRAQS